MNKSERVFRFIIPILLIVYIVLGRTILADYGVSRDERNERESLLVNCNYISELITGKSDPEIKELSEYSEKYYGMSAQFPMAIFEVVFKDDIRHLFLARHFYTFLFCCLGYICFYFFCSRVFKSKVLGILGASMVALYPRFFAEQFYNIKDMVFMALFMMCFWAIELYIESEYKWRYCFLFLLISTVAINVRIVGAVFAASLLGYMWIWGIRDKKLTVKKAVFQSGVIIIGTPAILAALTPIAWHSPIKEVINIFKEFLNYQDWSGTIVFMGDILHKNELPWYYIPIWLLISLPVWYLVLFGIAIGIIVFELFRLKKTGRSLFDVITRNKYIILAVVVGFGPWLMVAVTGATVYNAWRHFYFILPSIVLLALWTIKKAISSGAFIKKVCVAITIFGMASQLIWLVKYHPYQYVYFNEIGSLFADGFDRDYWTLSELPVYRYLKDVNVEITGRDYFSMKTEGAAYFEYLLKDDEHEKFNTYSENPDYYAAFYRGIVGNEYSVDGYNELKSFYVNGFKIATVYVREDLMQ